MSREVSPCGLIVITGYEDNGFIELAQDVTTVSGMGEVPERSLAIGLDALDTVEPVEPGAVWAINAEHLHGAHLPEPDMGLRPILERVGGVAVFVEGDDWGRGWDRAASSRSDLVLPKRYLHSNRWSVLGDTVD